MLLRWTVCFRFGCLGLLYCTFALAILDFPASVKWNYFRWHYMSTPTSVVLLCCQQMDYSYVFMLRLQTEVFSITFARLS